MSHRVFKFNLPALLLAASGLLTACGGGGGGSASVSPSTGTLIAGTISGLGSIIVNGVRYETVGANVLDADDGSTAITTPLRIGMTVSVEQNGTDPVTLRPIAGKILVQSGIQGVASYVGNSLTVAGLPVTTDTSTILLDANGLVTNLATLNNLSVEVYGLPQADGSYLATLVEAKIGPHPVQVVGTVQSINTSAKTLVLGTSASPITIDYASITPPSGLVAGAVVAVKSSATTTANAYSANSLQIRSTTASTYTSYASNYSGTTRVANERNELYGAVSDKATTSSGGNVTGCTFRIQGIQVQASSLALCDSIANGTYVEVKGTLSNGVLNSSRIEFEGSTSNGYSDDWNDSDSDGLHHRNLSTLNTATELQANRSFEIYGALSCSALNAGCTLTRGAVTYTADMSTARWDNYQSIVNGYVEAKGYLTGNTFKVIKIEVKDRRYGSGHGDDD
jgi:hypothetical protein